MNKSTIAVHAAIAVVWLSLALGICLRIALLGTEETSLARLSGNGVKIRADLTCKRDRLHATLDRQTSPTALEEAARMLNPPLSPSLRPTSVQTSPSSSTVAMTTSRP